MDGTYNVKKARMRTMGKIEEILASYYLLIVVGVKSILPVFGAQRTDWSILDHYSATSASWNSPLDLLILY